MSVYRHKPTTIDAFQLGLKGKPTPAPSWFPSPMPYNITADGIFVPTEGVGTPHDNAEAFANWGDYIIQLPDGKFEVISAANFQNKYEYVSE